MKKFLAWLKTSKKRQGVYFFVSMFFLFAVYTLALEQVKYLRDQNNIKNLMPISTDQITMEIEGIESLVKKSYISGWVFRMDAVLSQATVVLEATDSTEKIVVPTIETEQKLELSKCFELNEKYSPLGFKGEINSKKMNNDTCYEILLYITCDKGEDENQIKVSSGKYVYNQKIYSYNPKEFREPSIDRTVYEFVEDGTIVAYDLQKKIWIYEYNDKFYWVVEFSTFGPLGNKSDIGMLINKFYRTEDAVCGIKLERKYVGHYITAQDYTEYQDTDYYVYCMDIPEDENIFNISIGLYRNSENNSGWIYKAPYYPERVY